MRTLSLLIFLISSLQVHGYAQREEMFDWVVYYGDKASVKDFDPYKLIVLDPDTNLRLQPLLQQKKIVLGYVNLGEVDNHTPQFSQAQRAGLTLTENPDWPGSYAVDIRNPLWKKMLIEEIIPKIFQKGFGGLFFDQVDVSIALEREDPDQYTGMTAAAIDLVKTIRRTFPDKLLMLNRAYEILPDVGDVIDYELAESLYSEYNFETKTYFVLSPSENQEQLDLLNEARKEFPRLIVFSLDYWDPKDKKMYKQIYSIERGHGLLPYVSTVELDHIIPEPT